MGAEKIGQWMISPKSFVKLLGAEYDIMQKAGTSVLAQFYFAALAIVIIFFLSVASIWYAIALLFHDLIAEISLSCFFSLLFVCIYIFLINTFSKEQLPGKHGFLSASNIVRTSFIAFIAYLIAQPLALLVNGNQMEQQTIAYKQLVLNTHLRTIDSFYMADLEKLHERKAYCTAQNAQFSTHHFDPELALLDTEIAGIGEKIERMASEATRKVGSSSFFLFRIRTGSRYMRTWILTVIFILLFLLPGYLIFRISSDNAYYQLKKDYEKNLVVLGYLAFTARYKSIFKEVHGQEIAIFSRYEDPPFKRIRKTASPPGNLDDFLKKYITAAE